MRTPEAPQGSDTDPDLTAGNKRCSDPAEYTGQPIIAGLRDIGASIKRLEVQGALGIKELLDIGSVLDMALSARQYGSGDDNEEKHMTASTPASWSLFRWNI